jgi:hypothetical protein
MAYFKVLLLHLSGKIEEKCNKHVLRYLVLSPDLNSGSTEHEGVQTNGRRFSVQSIHLRFHPRT